MRWTRWALLPAFAFGSIGHVQGAAGLPAWALGEAPTLTGTLLDWHEGDAVAPGAGEIVATTFKMVGFTELVLASGVVAADGSFTLALAPGEIAATAAAELETAMCEGLNVTALRQIAPEQRIVSADLVVPARFEGTAHARPEGGIRIRSTPPSAGALLESYGFVFATVDGTLEGSCSAEGLTVVFELDLRQGWNTVNLEADGGIRIATAAIPPDAHWYFVNPLTLVTP